MEEIDNIIIVSEKNSMAQIKEALPYKYIPKISSFIEGEKKGMIQFSMGSHHKNFQMMI
jgi:hypothetical protein